MYKANQIANWFLSKSVSEDREISPMKLMKLCYIAQGVHLAVYNQKLIGDSALAWKYGPVFSEIYEKFKAYNGRFIPPKIADKSLLNNMKEYDRETTDILEAVWDSYGKYGAIKLSNWTHRKGSAWERSIDSGFKEFISVVIPAEYIKEEFDSIVKVHDKQRKSEPEMSEDCC